MKPTNDDGQISSLYEKLLDCWNRRDAADFAALFDKEGRVVGFDGSQMDGPVEIESHLRQIFSDHPTAVYVGKIRGVRFLAPDVALLRAVAGMVPPGQSDINPAVNAVQALVAVKQKGQWRIALFQNTPAAFHGRPKEGEKLTEELRQALRAASPDRRATKRIGDLPSSE